MLQPVGNLPARVYWRRRLVFVGLPLLGIILLLWVTLSGGSDHASSQTTSSTTTKASSSAPATSAQPRDTASIGVSTTTPKPTAPATTSATTAPSTSAAATGKGFCAVGDLTVSAATAKKSFAVKSKPELSMLVTNTAATPCKLDVADKHAEWRVYIGDARVWGSHDCAVKSGSNLITLTAHQAIRLSILWSGMTSAPACAGTRLAIQAGTYRLYAYFDGKASLPVTFTVK